MGFNDPNAPDVTFQHEQAYQDTANDIVNEGDHACDLVAVATDDCAELAELMALAVKMGKLSNTQRIPEDAAEMGRLFIRWAVCEADSYCITQADKAVAKLGEVE